MIHLCIAKTPVIHDLTAMATIDTNLHENILIIFVIFPVTFPKAKTDHQFKLEIVQPVSRISKPSIQFSVLASHNHHVLIFQGLQPVVQPA